MSKCFLVTTGQQDDMEKENIIIEKCVYSGVLIASGFANEK